MRKLWCLHLEPYPTRYTYQLKDWSEAAYQKNNVNYEFINGQTINSAGAIVAGSVLDAHGRSYWALTQTAEFVKLMQEGKVTSDDVVFVDDMFHPGLESLAYIFCQTPEKYRPKVFVRCWAQSFDVDDFIHRTGMLSWMRKYEEMLDKFIDGIFVANEELAANIRVSGLTCPVYVVGLPFGSDEARNRAGVELKPLHTRKKQIAFASRWDEEKQPEFFLEVVKRMSAVSDANFVLLTGHPQLKSSHQKYIDAAYNAEQTLDNFKIKVGLTKEEYYQNLANSQILINTALQDWIAFTNLEADALGLHTVSPAYKGMPETFSNNIDHLYVPWSVDSAVDRLLTSIKKIESQEYSSFNIGKLSAYCDDTYSKQLDCMVNGVNSKYYRGNSDYRHLVNSIKY
jgi:glycosyltransferase involved in cell wall biosynthesis